eukprot:TRINITY_DN824_c0_g2_i3.p1 TRINITY_DN824_c0_g2~~TRINITY_DN824_c0_g2_i3.p1  ORF type:complete len:925 (+),score=202.69 TRINITY_DN824_c0_g2_i3:61-2835(+)
METLLNFSLPLDVALLDNIVDVFYGPLGTPDEKEKAKVIIDTLNANENFWIRAPVILERSRSPNTKFIALNTLEQAIKYRWKIIPVEQQGSIRSFVVSFIIEISKDDTRMRSERVILRKLNEILVQLAKQEWPHSWGSFVSDLVKSSISSPSICENNMNILRMMSEEIFDFSQGQMTQAKIAELKKTFQDEFTQIYQLCDQILINANNPSLLEATLQTLLRFLNWIPLSFIFPTKLYEKIIMRFLPGPPGVFNAHQAITLQNAAIQCLTEIAGLKFESNIYDNDFRAMFVVLMQRMVGTAETAPLLPLTADLQSTWDDLAEPYQNFVQNSSMFLTAFFKTHLALLEVSGSEEVLVMAHRYLVSFTRVPELEVFKICLEYWSFLAMNLYESDQKDNYAFQPQTLFFSSPSRSVRSGRVSVYAPILTEVRGALIERMPRPEEVIIVEDENGQIVKETMKDSDALTRYNVMRETLVYLTHLDPVDTEKIMIHKLDRQVDGGEWSWNNLNTLCWAIGSISGAQSEDTEKHFLVTVIKDLLGLCEMKRGKDNKAVIASNIMYIVGQYPRFLRAHWKFLKTVVNKLFEFMHEKHPGVQDMACETFLKIAKKCQRKFVIMHPEEQQPFVEVIIDNLGATTHDLEPHQVQMFFEATGCMIQSADMQHRRDLVLRLMAYPQSQWTQFIHAAKTDPNILLVPETIKAVINILKIFSSSARSIGPSFAFQMDRIFGELLETYTFYSRSISSAIATQGPIAAKMVVVKNMRSVKKETLTLMEYFIENAIDQQLVYRTYVPSLLEAILLDYQANIPDARDSQVMSLVAVLISKMKSIIRQDIPRIFAAVFECTLDMIKTNFLDYPEHRTCFFKFLRAVNTSCFEAFFLLPANHLQLVVNSIVWGFKHTERNICETVGVFMAIQWHLNIVRFYLLSSS